MEKKEESKELFSSKEIIMTIKPGILTRVVQHSLHSDATTGAVIKPIYQTSTYKQEEPGITTGFDYSRADNPTREALEEALAALESAPYGLSFSSGVAAEQAIVQLLTPPCKILVCDDVYGGTGRLFTSLFQKYNFDFEFIDMTDLDLVKVKLAKNTCLVWIETPTNPTLKVIDIETVSKLAKKVDATVVVDNTFSSPVFQHPLELGADLVIHSTTKYIGGHSDLIGGAIMTKDKTLYEQLKFIQKSTGAVPSPFDCFLLLRSIKTLALRMKQHEKNALQIAHYLNSHPKVEAVYYPGLKQHPQFEIAKKQMSGFSGIVSFKWNGPYNEIIKMLKKLKIFILAESLGGVESLINHPEKMTHASVPKERQQQLGITSNLLRLSTGIEETTDLIQDLEQAFLL